MQSNSNQLHLRNHMHNIIDENDELRQRILKLTQIQKYVEVLLDKTQTLQKQKQYHQRQLGYIARQNQELKHQIVLVSTTQEQQMRTVFIEHDNIYRAMQQELNQIKVLHQKEIIQNDQLRLCLDKQSQIQNCKVQMFQKQINEYKRNLLCCQKQYQNVCHELQMQTQKHNIETDHVLKDFHHLKNIVIKQNCNKIEELMHENEKLRKDNTILVDYNETISNRSAVNQKELSQTIKELSSSIIKLNQIQLSLTKDNQQLNGILSQTQHRLRQMTEQAAALLQQNLRLKQELTEGCRNSQRLCYLLQQSDKQNANLRQKLKQLDQYIEKQSQIYTQKLFFQAEQVYFLKQKLSQKQITITQKLSQIKQLLQIVDQLQMCSKSKEKQLKLLSNDTEKLQEQLKKVNLKLEQKIVQLRSCQETIKLYKQNIDQLEELNAKQKQSYLQLETQNYNLTRQLQNPREITKQSEAMLQKLIKQFHLERDQMALAHEKQKNRIRETHQFQIKQQQLQYLRKIQIFSQQLERIKGIHTIEATIRTFRR